MRRLLLLVALVMAGCVAPGATSPTPPARPDGAFAFAEGLALPIDCLFACVEPTLVADPQGRLMASDGPSHDLAMSPDGGATWGTVPGPALPNLPLLTTWQGDTILQLSPAGRIYFSTLVVHGDPRRSASSVDGIQIAWTDDAGATWGGNVYLTLQDHSSPLVDIDRQWLAFGEGQTMYLAYTESVTGTWIARSTDAGATWSGWTLAASTGSRESPAGQSGPPEVDERGRVIVPACVDNDDKDAVFISADEGKTFTRHDVGPGGCVWFPMLAHTRGGGLVAAWPGGPIVGSTEANALVATSEDGTTWSTPVTWATKTTAAPWPLAGPNGTLALVWYSIDGKTADLHVTRGALAAGPIDDIVVAKGLSGPYPSPANTDYASAAWLPDGRIGVVWSDAKVIRFAASLT